MVVRGETYYLRRSGGAGGDSGFDRVELRVRAERERPSGSSSAVYAVDMKGVRRCLRMWGR